MLTIPETLEIYGFVDFCQHFRGMQTLVNSSKIFLKTNVVMGIDKLLDNMSFNQSHFH